MAGDQTLLEPNTMDSGKKNQKQFISVLRQLPVLMRQIINNQSMIDNTIALSEHYQLSPVAQDRMMALVRALIAQEISVALIPEEVRKIGVAPERYRGFVRDFLGRIILPMEWYTGSVQSMIQAYGGRPEEYLADLHQQFPEVYAPKTSNLLRGDNGEAGEHTLLRNFSEKIETSRGRADILLRLTGLAGQIDEMMKKEEITQALGEELMRSLDTLSYAVNTQDLNPLEVQSLKRRLRKVLSRLPNNGHQAA